MKKNKSISRPLNVIGAFVFLIAFVFNVQTSLNGDWELFNVAFAQGSGGSGAPCPTGNEPGCPYKCPDALGVCANGKDQICNKKDFWNWYDPVLRCHADDTTYCCPA